jgi:hypothetical protein
MGTSNTSNNWGCSLRWTSIPPRGSNAPSHLNATEIRISLGSDEALIGSEPLTHQCQHIYTFVVKLSSVTVLA